MAELTLFLTLVLLLSAAHKILEPERLAVAVTRLTGVPVSLAPVVNAGVAVMEIAAAIALLFAASTPVGAILATLIWCIYGVALARHFGNTLDCGCSFAAREKSIGYLDLARSFGLALLALATLAMPFSPFSILTPFAAAGFLALYVAGGELTSIFIPQRRGTA